MLKATNMVKQTNRMHSSLDLIRAAQKKRKEEERLEQEHIIKLQEIEQKRINQLVIEKQLLIENGIKSVRITPWTIFIVQPY